MPQDLLLGKGIDARKGVVQDQNRRVPQHGARNADALLLSAGKRNPPLADKGLHAAGKTLHIGEDLGDLRRPFHLALRRTRHAESNVVPHRLAEQKRLLWHESDLRAQISQRILLNRNTVYEDRSEGWVVEPGQQMDERRLARARRPHQRHGPAGRNLQADIFQHVAAVVGKRKMAEFDLASKGGGRRIEPACPAVVNIRLGVEDGSNPLERSLAALEQVRHPAQRDHRPDQVHQIDMEGREGAQADFSLPYMQPPDPENRAVREAEKKRQAGIEAAPQFNQPPVGADQLQIHVPKLAELRGLLPIRAQDTDADGALPHLFAEGGIQRLDLLVAVMNLLAENLHHQEDHRQRRQNQQRQPPIEMKHQYGGAQPHNQRIGGIHDAGADHHAHGVEVVRRLRHQLAGPAPVIEPKRKLHQVAEQIVPQIVFDFAGDAD